VASYSFSNISNTDPLLLLLNQYGLYDQDETNNFVPLPATQEFAQAMGEFLPYGSMSPHTGGPQPTYEQGTLDTLTNLRNSYPAEWALAQQGDQNSLQFFRDLDSDEFSPVGCP
jgi:hypothetical protein